MNKNPFDDTFDEYMAFHQNIMKKANEKTHKITESDDKSIIIEEFMKSHNMIPLDKFLKEMNEKYGI